MKRAAVLLLLGSMAGAFNAHAIRLIDCPTGTSLRGPIPTGSLEGCEPLDSSIIEPLRTAVEVCDVDMSCIARVIRIQASAYTRAREYADQLLRSALQLPRFRTIRTALHTCETRFQTPEGGPNRPRINECQRDALLTTPRGAQSLDPRRQLLVQISGMINTMRAAAIVHGSCVAQSRLGTILRCPNLQETWAAGEQGPRPAAPEHTDELRFYNFPVGFKWGVATAAYQNEGGNTNSDWWAWEQTHPPTLHGGPSGQAADHWNRVGQDTQILRTLGVNSYRMSFEWARIEPSEGVWDMEVVRHYQNEIRLLQRNGIDPMVTLWHVTLPQWVRDRGGWAWDGIPWAFARYAAFAYETIAPTVRYWVTLNEPFVHLGAGYMAAVAPPMIHNPALLGPPMHGLVAGHVLAYRRLHEIARRLHREVRIGVAHHLMVFDGYRPNVIDPLLAYGFGQGNWTIADALQTGRIRFRIPGQISIDETLTDVHNMQDFIGVNYYTRHIIRYTSGMGPNSFVVDPGQTYTEMPTDEPAGAMEIYPRGFYLILKEAARRYPGVPIMITENGIVDHAMHDVNRQEFIRRHLVAMHEAMLEGVPVQGYYHWTVMDNFEWNYGYRARTGLYSVNFDTQVRTPRDSAALYSRIIQENGVWATCCDGLNWSRREGLSSPWLPFHWIH